MSTKVTEKGEEAGIKEVRLYFKQGGEDRYYYAPMVAGEKSNYTGVIPAPALGAGNIEYRFFVIDNEQRFAKTDPFAVQIEDDEQALMRMQKKPPQDVKIDISEAQDIQDSVKKINKSREVTDADRANTAKEAGEPDSSSRVDVRTEEFTATSQLKGFLDYINLLYVAPVGGIALASATIVGTTAAAPVGAILGGIAAVGVAAAAGGSSSGGGHSDGSSGGGTSSIACNSVAESGGDAANSYNVALGKNIRNYWFWLENVRY